MATVLARYSNLKLMDHFRVPADLQVKLNDIVVLKTRRGLEIGQVKLPPAEHKLRHDDIVAGEVLRKSTLEDSTKFRESRFEDFRDLKRKFKELATRYKLPMRYLNSERLLSGDKLIVYFYSEDRLDFRDFVKDFTEAAGARIELRQLGARDAARVTGDVGVCGQELCCISYIIDFVPVSMKMAKTQRISLDPAKISGQCGRLKCCLKYEDDLYNSLKQHVPLEGQPVTCDGKDCHACGVDILRQKVTVDFGDGKREERDAAEIQFEAGWTDKDIRRYKRERRARVLEERAARDAARSARMKPAGDRRFGQDAVHPGRREADVPGADAPSPLAADQSAVLEPVDVDAPSDVDPLEPTELPVVTEAPALPQPAEADAEADQADAGPEDAASDAPVSGRRRRGRSRRRGPRPPGTS